MRTPQAVASFKEPKDMGNVYEALRQAEIASASSGTAVRQEWTCREVTEPLAFPSNRLEGAATLGSDTAVDHRLVTMSHDRGAGAEQFRILSVRLRDRRKQAGLRKILVTSSVPGEGKSVVAANLAVSLARGGGENVLLLGGDLLSPGLNRLLGCDGIPGIHECLNSDQPYIKYLYRVAPFSLWFLPPGKPNDRINVLESVRLKELLELLSSSFEWLVIDSPPLLPLADANVWARMVDGVLLVVREGKTSKKYLQRAISVLGSLQLLGVVVNECSHVNADGY